MRNITNWKTCQVMVLVVLQDLLNIKSPALVYFTADVRDIHWDESVRKCGWSVCTPQALSRTPIHTAHFPLNRDGTKLC